MISNSDNFQFINKMKAKAQILLFVLCFFVTKNKAQIYFNNQYDATGNFDATNSIDTFQNKYLTIGIEGVFGSHWGLSCYLLNQDGTVYEKKTYGFQGVNLLPNNGKYISMGNQFYVCGSRAFSGYKISSFLWRFDANLDSVKYLQYGFLNQQNVITSFVKHSDNKLYMVGYVDDTLQTNSDVLLIKTDTAGNEIWKKKIGLAGWDETGLSIDTLQGQLIIAGYKTPHNANTYSGFVMRLDTAGNTIWNRPINTNYFGGGQAKKLKDGNILVYSQYKKYTLGSDNYGLLQVEKVTPNNTTLWSKQIGPIGINIGPSSAIENKHGNIVIDGQVGIPTNIINGIVYEISQNGDSIFSREYAIMPGSQNYFRDVIQTNDGGYCFAGFVSPVFANGGTGTEDIWLLKVDSNFCESASSCGYGVGINELEMGLNWSVYPNPATNELYFIFNTDVTTDVTVNLYNVTGQLVKTKSFKTDDEPKLLELHELNDGIYFYQILTANGLLKANKVVIIK